MAKISVVIPVFNAGKTIIDCIESVLRQSFEDYDIIVVNDGSSDSTLRLLESFSRNIKIITIENSGPAVARNTGIKASNSEYIAFLDADDTWYSEKLEKQYNLIKQKNVELIYCDCKRIFPDGSTGLRSETHKMVRGWIIPNLIEKNIIATSSALVSQKALNKIGIFSESKKILHAEDYHLWVRIADKFKVDYVDEPLLNYNVSSGGFNSLQFEKSLKASEYVFNKIITQGFQRPIDIPQKEWNQLISKAKQLRNIKAGLNIFSLSPLKARHYFFKAIGFKKNGLKALIFLIATFLPKQAISWIKYVINVVNLNIKS